MNVLAAHKNLKVGEHKIKEPDSSDSDEDTADVVKGMRSGQHILKPSSYVINDQLNMSAFQKNVSRHILRRCISLVF